MNRLLFSCVLGLAGLSVVAQAPPAIMPLREIRPGMKGYGRTVFQGGKIEKFSFEVLGVQSGVTPGHSMILIKASGGPLAETGIMQGMSGSPCYIEGQLIGALSSGWQFQKEPLAGVTPIGEMLDQLRDIPDTPAVRTPLILPKLEPPKVLKAALRGEMIPLSELMGPASGQLPMVLSGTGLDPEVRSLWTGTGVEFTAAGMGTGRGIGEPSPLEPGGMASIALMQGDMEMAASGTITYVSGRRVLLFGHPLFNLGPVDLPLWSATVSGNVASYATSFKLAQPVAPVGALRLDRSSGVAGTLGAEARMIPLRVGLNLGGKRTLNFRFEVMDHPTATPALVATAVAQTLNSQVRSLGFTSLSMQGNIKLANHPAIQVENVVADLNTLRVSQYLGAILQAITLNPFERPVFEGISVTIKAEERLDRTIIAGVRPLKARVKRGEVLPVLVTLQNIQGVRETATFNVNVPQSARPGLATLMVGDGMSLLNADPDERAIDITDLGDMVRIINNSLRNNHVYALMVQAQPGAGLRGARIEGVPPSITTMLGSDGDSRTNQLQKRIVSRALLPLEREVNGLVSLDVEIE
nr:SpoIVB peptidase S55 domain-containing protein [uncultured Holophaga sp.]